MQLNNFDLNINRWFIYWGLMSGHLKDETIETTKFGIYNQLFGFTLSLIETIKFIILLFHPIGSKWVHLLGDFSYFFGPKVITDLMIIIVSAHYLIEVCLFYYCSMKPEKMFFWLDVMQYDKESRCFNKLKLNKCDSEVFIKRFSISAPFVMAINYMIQWSFFVVGFIPAYLFQRDYFLYYSLGIMLFGVKFYYLLGGALGVLVIIYQVNLISNLIKI